MPVLKHAKKKLRADIKKQVANRTVRTRAVSALDKAKKTKEAVDMSEAYRRLDRAAKTGVFHKGKVDRLKSRLAKLFLTLKK